MKSFFGAALVVIFLMSFSAPAWAVDPDPTVPGEQTGNGTEEPFPNDPTPDPTDPTVPTDPNTPVPPKPNPKPSPPPSQPEKNSLKLRIWSSVMPSLIVAAGGLVYSQFVELQWSEGLPILVASAALFPYSIWRFGFSKRARIEPHSEVEKAAVLGAVVGVGAAACSIALAVLAP